jgi:SAM-dependent methyltransferase
VPDATRRFSNRVEHYLKYRPTYPAEIIPLLESECGLTAESVIADLGSGTGLLTELFLKHGNPVFGVEPNQEMRSAGEKALAKYPKFTSVNAAAEATTLTDHSVDLIVAGQAFHWFDREKARAEFVRILKPEGWLMLVWNGFRIACQTVADFQQVFQQYGTDYQDAIREITDEEIQAFYEPGKCSRETFFNQQVFDFEGLKGRLLSMSYAPQPDHRDYEPMMQSLRGVFERNQKDNQVVIEYDTAVYYGQLK